MATFIKQKPFTGFNSAGEEVLGYRLYSDSELLDLIEAGSSKFFDVPEAHASQVLRKQHTYQELTDDVLEAYRATIVPPKPVDVAEVAAKAAADLDPAVLAAILQQHGGERVQESNDTPEDGGSGGGVRVPEAEGADTAGADSGDRGSEGTADTRTGTDKPATGTPRRRTRSRKGGGRS